MSMSCDQRLCPGVGGCRCRAFMSPLFKYPHPTCARCRGVRCTADVICDICRDWSVAQWEVFLKWCPYSGCRKPRPSGSALPPAPQTTLPSASSSSEAGRPATSPTLDLFPFIQRGLTAQGGGGCRSRGLSRGSPSSSLPLEGGEGGIAMGALASGGARVSAASSLTGGGVADSSLSQESLVMLTLSR